MESVTLAELGATEELTTNAAAEDVSKWLTDNEAFRLRDVEYAISITELGATRERDGISTALAIGALVVALGALGANHLNEWLQLALATFVVFALGATVRIQTQHVTRRTLLRRLYDLRDRAPRYFVPVRRWSRQGQVYLAPKGKAQ